MRFIFNISSNFYIIVNTLDFHLTSCCFFVFRTRETIQKFSDSNAMKKLMFDFIQIQHENALQMNFYF